MRAVSLGRSVPSESLDCFLRVRNNLARCFFHRLVLPLSSRRPRVSLDSCLRPEMLAVCLGEYVAAIACSNKIEVIAGLGIEHGLNRCQAWIADRAGRKSHINVGVVGRINLQIRVEEVLFRDGKSILDRGAALQLHLFLETVKKHPRYNRPLFRVLRFPLNDGRQNQRFPVRQGHGT